MLTHATRRKFSYRSISRDSTTQTLMMTFGLDLSTGFLALNFILGSIGLKHHGQLPVFCLAKIATHSFCSFWCGTETCPSKSFGLAMTSWCPNGNQLPHPPHRPLKGFRTTRYELPGTFGLNLCFLVSGSFMRVSSANATRRTLNSKLAVHAAWPWYDHSSF